MKKKQIVVAVSGGFDPLHFGHVRYLQDAKKLGDELVVILNNDNWLKDKKGFAFMPERERKELVCSIVGVDRVIVTHHKPGEYLTDRSVIKELKKLKPDIFANGGDRLADNIPEYVACEALGIKMVFGVGAGGKVQSSSWLTKKVVGSGVTDVRPWGNMVTHKVEPHYWIKTINVAPGHRLSLQKHRHRSETWVCVEGTMTAEVGEKTLQLKPGMTVTFPPNTPHRLSSDKGGTIVEVGYGSKVEEEDIVRYEDDYGRK